MKTTRLRHSNRVAELSICSLSKQTQTGDMDNIERLVCEFGFGRVEAKLALNDTNGNLELAIDRLLNGQDAPPPYDEPSSTKASFVFDPSTNSSSFGSKVKSFLPGRKKQQPYYEDHPTAPGFNEISKQVENQLLPPEDQCLPPPYEKVVKLDSIQKWEREAQVIFFNENAAVSSSFQNPLYNERCCSCFNELQNQETAQQHGKVCFFHIFRI